MKVLYFGTYDRTSPRNTQVVSCLRRAGVTVVERHRELWGRHNWSPGVGTLVRLARAELALSRTRAGDADVVLVGYPGHPDMLSAQRVARGRPLVFNPLVSLADTLVDDRGVVRRRSARGVALRALDRRAFRGADLVVADTEAHAASFREAYGLPRERDDLPVGRRVQLLLHEDLVHPRVLQRAGAIPGRHEGAHESQRDPGVERVLSRELPPPPDRIRQIAPLGRLSRQLLQGRGVAVRQARALLFRPALELRSAGEVKAVEEAAGVARGREVEAVGGQSRLELAHVARDHVGIEPEVLPPAEEHVVGAEVLAQGVHRLAQPTARAVLLGVRPEIGEHLLPGEAGVPRGGQQGEQREPARLGGGAGHDLAGPADMEPAEGVHVQRVAFEDRGHGSGCRPILRASFAPGNERV